MKYNRRANRPDANYYRETRRRSLGSRRDGKPVNPKVLVVAIIVIVGVIAYVVWK